MAELRKKGSRRRWKAALLLLAALLVLHFAFTKVVHDAIYSRVLPVSDATRADPGEPCYFPCGRHTLCGYLCEGSRTDALVVLVPGLSSRASTYEAQIRFLQEYGFPVFAIDCTGQGRSGGESAVGLPQEWADLEAALAYLEENGRFGRDKILLFGHSAGGYAVCCGACGRESVAGVVSVSGVNSAMDAVAGVSAGKIGPVAYANYPFLYLCVSALFGAERTGASAAGRIRESGVPALIVHGSGDELVDIGKTSVLAHLDGGEAIETLVWDVPGQDGHTSILREADGSANRALMDEVCRFYESCLQ